MEGESVKRDGRPPLSKTMLVRHSSFVRRESETNTNIIEEREKSIVERETTGTEYVPVVRSGACADIGSRRSMEDVYICCDDFSKYYGVKSFDNQGPSAFYGVFDGHGGKHAADFASKNLPKYIVEDSDFPSDIEKVLSSAFEQTDSAFAKACSLNCDMESGTTALTALVVGGSLVVANAGDCRAVLCRRGKAIELSRDHKPSCVQERRRVESSGGYVYDGYLNGLLSVTRALGDWHMEGLKVKDDGSDVVSSDVGPLIGEPEVREVRLSEEDEFLILGCDGIWEVFRSQNAVDFARRKLQEHNDPEACCRELIDEAIKRKSSDNLAVVMVCFNQRPPPVLTSPRPRVQRSISAEGLKELQGFLDSLSN